MSAPPELPPPFLPWERVPPSRALLRWDWIANSAGFAWREHTPAELSGLEAGIVHRLARDYEAVDAILTNSGTGALTLALSIAFRAQRGNRVALPAYTCYSVATAVAGAGGDAVLYDIDPWTLCPSEGSVEEVLRSGLDVLVVSPLYGYPANLPALISLARRYGAIVVEDAAQAAGATFRGRPIGSFAPLSTLSFGRGKGMTCGGGGALLVRDPGLEALARREAHRLAPPARGSGSLVAAFGEWGFGRTELYGVPASLPFLGLGKTRYHDPAPVERIGIGPLALLGAALEADPLGRILRERRKRAEALRKELSALPDVQVVRPIPEGMAGELRLPFRVPGLAGRGCPRLGVTPGYPTTLAGIPRFRPYLRGSREPLPGAALIVLSLLTAPTHPWAPTGLPALVSEWMRKRERGIGLAGSATVTGTDHRGSVPAITGTPLVGSVPAVTGTPAVGGSAVVGGAATTRTLEAS